MIWSCPMSHLAVNDVINFMEKTCWNDVKAVIYQLYGIKPHSYQRKERNDQGPEIRHILRNLARLTPIMQVDVNKSMYLDSPLNIKKVNDGVFETELHQEWRQ